MLKENEWNTINNTLLEIYTIKDTNQFAERILKMLRMCIPYTKGYYLIFDEKNEVDKEKSIFIGMKQEDINRYLDYYYKVDYIKFVLEYAKTTITYRDTDILEDEMRKKTELYRGFLSPLNIPYGCGVILMQDEKIVGIINLYRSAEFGDFSEKDMYILEAFKLHLRNIAYELYYNQKENNDVKFKNMCKQYELSERECEVIRLVSKGKSNTEIGESLAISLSTVKKHFYNVYHKTGVKSRTQLLALMK